MNPASRRTKSKTYLIVLLSLLFCVLASPLYAQTDNSETGSETPEAETETVAIDTATAAADSEFRTLNEDFLVLGEFGVGAGFPGYQLYNLNISFQRETLGVAFRGSWTAAGPHVSLAGRYYTPIPIPAPTYLGAGAGITGSNPTFFAVFGGHIPLGFSNFRVNLEAGGAYTPVLDEWTFLPTVSVGLGYTFFIDAAPIPPEELERRRIEREARNAGCTEITEPTSAGLDTAFRSALERELNEAKATFAGVYRLNGYSRNSTETEIDGDRATITVRFTARITEVLTGNVQETSGTVTARFRWNGCRWSYSGRSFS